MFWRRNMSESLTEKLGYLAIIGLVILAMTRVGFVYAPTLAPLLVFLAALDSLMLALVATKSLSEGPEGRGTPTDGPRTIGQMSPVRHFEKSR